MNCTNLLLEKVRAELEVWTADMREMHEAGKEDAARFFAEGCERLFKAESYLESRLAR